MKVQINTDKHIEGHERVEAYFSGEITKTLGRFEDKITRVEVHFGDENSNKSGIDDKRCLIEVRPVNSQPIAVTEHSSTIEKAFHGAIDKVKRSLTTTFEKQKAY
ncbi:Sigma 54 modulation protein / S30EA ribosomal protein [Flavobacterium succinicans]|jgi:ribosome-associated translation inhibitor RaiA|uniref:Sigma 54 modulation protein / S30EA ribosomal protein n=1 Tax=Flavobacterium succinicans TaxID=29536 RepID=A0A1I4UXW2_9FLAO|nr:MULTISPECIES: HPF/RaiA family ribosome-associated protein [Flavobacterium]OOV28434.1 ribosomal subunit interface protein [Flavobacterium sp. LM5]SFM93771.1 Sigma 54 modulation protein / S30EA ribosomal protein [Flavobacterium succinicans]